MTVITATIWLFRWRSKYVGSVIGLVLPSIKSLSRNLCVIWIVYNVQTHRYQDLCCAFCGKLFFMSLKCPVFRTSSCEWTYSYGIYTISYSIALKFLSMSLWWWCLRMQCYDKALKILFYLPIQPWIFLLGTSHPLKKSGCKKSGKFYLRLFLQGTCDPNKFSSPD